MPSAPTLSADKRKKSSATGLSYIIIRSKKAHAGKDELLRDDLPKYEKDLIMGCREIGMTDEEIKKWLQEI